MLDCWGLPEETVTTWAPFESMGVRMSGHLFETFSVAKTKQNFMLLKQRANIFYSSLRAQPCFLVTCFFSDQRNLHEKPGGGRGSWPRGAAKVRL